MSDISIMTPREMMDVLRQAKAPSTWLLDTFFPSRKQHTASKVDIDIVTKDGRKLAPFVSPKLQGKVMKHEGFKTNTFSLPYVKILTTVEANDVEQRLPGETIYDLQESPEQRAARILGEDLAEAKGRIVNRKEYMAAQLLNSGVVNCDGDGTELEIDFEMPATHKITLTNTDLWTNDASDPIADIEEWVELVAEDSGIYPTDLILGKDSAAAFRGNKKILELIDNRRVELGTLQPEMIAQGVRRLMYLPSCNVTVWQYSASYVDDSNVAHKFVPDDAAWLASRGAKVGQHFGLIKDLDVGNAAVEFFAKSWREKNPSAEFLLVQSAPLVAMHQSSAFLRATVV